MVVAGLGMAIDPVRLGLAVVMLARRKPMLNLAAFWLGGIAAGISISVAVLLLMRDVALVAIRNLVTAVGELRSGTFILEGPRIMITVGVISLVGLAVMMARAKAATQVGAAQPAVGGGNTAVLVEEERPQSRFARMGARTHAMLDGDSLWPAFAVGVITSFPPYEGVVVLAFIMASGTSLTTQFSAFIIFTLMVLAVIEIPLVSYLVIPGKTEAVMLRIQHWLRKYRAQIAQVILGGTGVTFLVQGIAAL
ncbi:GAP family protein [Mycobacterium sp. UM_CSW]|uniref:GAP family protein n=1 Tax=Mycobacterium sp. UM_CSW TaxID=1370119 RepID=UPI001EF9CCEB|nr:GAP family protein [Mycobacterium sp. UM_CSW]